MDRGNLGEIAREQWSICERVGWHNKTPLEHVALIHEELGEVSREFRKIDPEHDHIAEEIADVILRCCDLAECQRVDIVMAIEAKLVKNRELQPNPDKFY